MGVGPITFWRSNKDIATLLGVDITTVRRWRRGAICPPKAVVFLLSGDLGYFDEEWRGWRVKNGALISPEGWVITVSDVLSVPLMRAQIATYQTENRKLREPQFDEQPMPEEWDLEQLQA